MKRRFPDHRALILGTGVGYRTHFPSLLKCLDKKNIGVVTRSPQDAKRITENELGYYGANMSEAIREFIPDSIIVGLPPFLHVSAAEELSNSNATILFEKPVGISFSDCVEINQRLIGNQVIVNFQLRGLPLFLKIRALIQKCLGDLHLVKIHENSSAYIGHDPEKWYFDPLKGGGQRLSMLTHLVDFAQFITQSNQFQNIHQKMDCSEGLLLHTSTIEFQSGKILFQISSSSRCYSPRSLSFSIYGERGSIDFEFVNGKSKCYIYDDQGRKSLGRVSGSEKSIFKLAMPHYLYAIFSQIEQPTNDNTILASILDAKNVHRILNS